MAVQSNQVYLPRPATREWVRFGGASAKRFSFSVTTGGSLNYPDKIWIGQAFCRSGVFVLGQSSYGCYEGDIATDDGYIKEYLSGRIHDAAYDRWARASGKSKCEFWNNVMFTNLVLWTGPKRNPGPTDKQFKNAKVRLNAILDEHKPKALWIIGKTQSRYSVLVATERGIKSETVAIRASNEDFAESWSSLSNLLR